MNYLKIHFQDRFGPDLVLTHWMLYFKPFSRKLVQSRLRIVGHNVHVRPYVTVTNGRNIIIGSNVVIRPFTCIMGGDGNTKDDEIIIGDDVLIGPGVWMSCNRHEFRDPIAPIMDQGYKKPSRINISRGAWIGTRAILLPGTEIGRNAVVGAGAVVSGHVESHTMVAGNPGLVQ